MKQSVVVCCIIPQKFDGVVKILVTQRSLTMDFLPGAYELPGGHAEEGESHEQALRRELQEELNLEVRVGELCDSFRYQTKTENVTEYIYFALATSPLKNIRIKADEVQEYRWITADEVDTLVTANKRPDDPELAILRRAFGILKAS